MAPSRARAAPRDSVRPGGPAVAPAGPPRAAVGGYPPQPPAYGGYPPQPAYGGYPQQPAYGGYPQQPAYGGYPPQPAYGGYPPHQPPHQSAGFAPQPAPAPMGAAPGPTKFTIHEAIAVIDQRLVVLEQFKQRIEELEMAASAISASNNDQTATAPIAGSTDATNQ